MSTASLHPDASTLEDYAAGLDVAGSRERLEAHLVTCEVCAATLARSDAPTLLTLRIGEALRASRVKPIGSHLWFPSLPYIVMEYVEGESLQSQLDCSVHFTPHEIAEIGLQIAEGLNVAHACGLIHRDVKPDNIHIESMKRSPCLDAGPVDRITKRNVRLTDFGLARLTDDAQFLTVERMVMGTPAFMSPEQVNAEVVDQHSDLFSLGCVLYALCSGRSPFSSESIAATLRKVNACNAPQIQTIAPAIPSSLVAVIHRLMARNPADRFQTAVAVVDAMRALLGEQWDPNVPQRASGTTRE